MGLVKQYITAIQVLDTDIILNFFCKKDQIRWNLFSVKQKAV